MKRAELKNIFDLLRKHRELDIEHADKCRAAGNGPAHDYVVKGAFHDMKLIDEALKLL